MERLKNTVKKLFQRPIYNMSHKFIFTDIYLNNKWGSKESVSGSGSELANTFYVREALEVLIKKYGIQSIVDLPCGDCNWIRDIDFHGADYVGYDVVFDIILKNDEIKNNHFKKADYVCFETLDVVNESFPDADLVLCRDMLVHFCYEDIFKALANIKKSGSKYLLTTSFVQHKNINIKTGEWRPLNIWEYPFENNMPVDAISERCQEKNGQYRDKALLLFNLKNFKI